MTNARKINGVLRRIPPWLVYLVGIVPAVWFFYLGLTGGLGVEPIKPLEHELGRFSLKLLIVVLAVTPLHKVTGISLIRFRRALGLVAFFYVVVHLLVWLFLDVQIWSQIWKDILKRPYITIGMVGFVLMLPLAATSNNLSVRRMSAVAWKRLHWLTYPAIVLGAVHFVMVQKVWEAEPLIYLAVIFGLLASRLKLRHKRSFVSTG
ncbi:MAG: protein-methionine-sulfoxide reductase heme-binding subunit MsrQ [Marinosulfonomonas sp.]|nr:protein-methionine-sulfoxide reductase heme-binding subunit MsrQ [Marinosulfonomonas sp.]